MTIDRVLIAAAPRIEKGGAQFAQPSALEGESGVNPAEKRAFSSVLGAMTDVSTEIADPVDQDDMQAASPAQVPVLPVPDPRPVPDSAPVLAQWAGTFRLEASTTGEGLSAAAASDLPGDRPGAALASAIRARHQGSGVMLADPDDGGDGQVLDAGTVPRPVGSTLAHRTLAGGLPTGQGFATGTDGAPGRAGDGQRGAEEVASTVRADWRAATVASAERLAFSAFGWSDSSGSGFRPFPTSRSSDRASGRTMFMPLDAAAPGSVASSSYPALLASGAAPTATADAPMAAGTSSDVAHKVHYWVTRGVQTAELQLDAPGGTAVDVSITLQGKEALVEFRSDQPDARRVLQEAMPQLREMLRAEGLQLAGGFVGSSAQQKQGDARPDGQRRTAEPGGTVRIAASDAVRSGRPGAASTHALDVFV